MNAHSNKQKMHAQHTQDNRRRINVEEAAPSYPSTNNEIEAANAVIKKQHPLRERLPVESNSCTVSAVRDPSIMNCIRFVTIPSISLQK